MIAMFYSPLTLQCNCK